MYTEALPFDDSAQCMNLPSSIRRLPRVLLVDDDLFMLGVVDDLLHELGVTGVTKALGGMAALAALDAMPSPPGLVLCDLDMPAGDGFRFMEELGARAFPGSVVLMSGMNLRALHSPALMTRFHRVNVAGSLDKPISRDALGGVLDKLVLPHALEPLRTSGAADAPRKKR